MIADDRLTPPLRVLLADDHAVVREGVRGVFASARDMTVDIVGEADNGDAAVALAESLAPDVLILDLSMPGLNGIDVLERLRERAPAVRSLVLSIHDDEEYVLRAVRGGARGYLRKDSTPAELRDAVRTIAEGGTYFSPPVARRLSDALRQEGATRDRDDRIGRLIGRLTQRERDVLVEIAGGATNKEIASQLGISVRTVESHRESLMRKLEVRGAASLTRLAMDSGLLDSGIRTTTE